MSQEMLIVSELRNCYHPVQFSKHWNTPCM